MSGILDNKSRVLDTIVTLEGRRALVNGGLDVAYATFTDATAFYEADSISGSTDATARVYLENCYLPQDDITFKSDNAGKLMPFGNTTPYGFSAGQLLDYSFIATSSSILTGSADPTLTVLLNDDFLNAADGLLTSSVDNFQKLRVIGTHDNVFDDGFAVAPDNIVFVANETNPISQRVQNVDDLEGLFQDPRFSHLLNFKYLPPIIKTDDSSIDKSDPSAVRDRLLGNYPSLGRSVALDSTILKAELDKIAAAGYSRVLIADPTSKLNNVLCQVFEITNTAMSKLDILDFGKVTIDNVIKHVFFLGKVVQDSNMIEKFVHVFTLVFE